MTITPIILCGGSGTRLWPLSREACPKQFVDLGDGHTLFKDTLRRALSVEDVSAPIVVCNEEHRFYVKDSLAECDSDGLIVLEPSPRNTAPAIALAAFAVMDAAQGKNGDIAVVLPSDHLLKDAQAFRNALKKAARIAEDGGIVTFGILPTGPETGFGYVQRGEKLNPEGFRVARFVEKPDRDRAAAMLEQGSFYWNSGMFVFRASTYLSELERFAPEMHECARRAWELCKKDESFTRPDADAFLASPADSIDYAVMEKTDRAAVCPLDTTWNDLGSWEALYQTGDKDEDGNVRVGDVLTENVRNCYLRGGKRLVTALDIENLAIVETADAILVAPRASVQNVKHLVNRLKKDERPEYRQHPVVFRPWGSYESLTTGPGFQVKRITVNPGQQLSLQLHHHRAEHWVVVCGTAEITNGDAISIFRANQSTYIPVETKHRLKNPGSAPLVIIEVQSGDYLGEDDIERFEDNYGRVSAQA